MYSSRTIATIALLFSAAFAHAQTIAAGDHHSLSICNDGTPMAWGRNAYGQLGNGATGNSYLPGTVAGLTGAVAIAAGKDHSMAIKNDGTVWTAGLNTYGQLGIGTNGLSEYFVQVGGLTGIIAVAVATFILLP